MDRSVANYVGKLEQLGLAENHPIAMYSTTNLKFGLELTLLLLLAPSVFYVCFHVAETNGTSQLATEFVAARKLPDTTIDGGSPSLALHTISFTGATSAAWILLLLEGYRTGNAGTILLTFALVAAVYCVIHLIISTTAHNPTPQSILVPRALFMTIWQLWPAFVSIIVLASTLFSSSTSTKHDRATLRSLRFVYAIAFTTAMITHLISWTIPLATLAASRLFREEYLQPLHPLVVFAIPDRWDIIPVGSVAAGVHAFLAWDYLVTCAAVLVWAVRLHGSAYRAVSIHVGYIGVLVNVVTLTVVAGPVGAAVGFIWERDELVIAGGVDKEDRRLCKGDGSG
ncbi:hypothetical protein BDW59DRAFT_180572 [Aspergillus cavernicola]|uniref:Uncharacterized protein n=1 Tax=Aspergillus cavernicola TaxID=176166 RepID=A0ABR4I7V2_9EURO